MAETYTVLTDALQLAQAPQGIAACTSGGIQSTCSGVPRQSAVLSHQMRPGAVVTRHSSASTRTRSRSRMRNAPFGRTRQGWRSYGCLAWPCIRARRQTRKGLETKNQVDSAVNSAGNTAKPVKAGCAHYCGLVACNGRQGGSPRRASCMHVGSSD